MGRLFADPGRCRMLLALDDGRELPAGRLAQEAGVSAATASGHLQKLVDAGLLAVEPRGRHRYFRLAGPDVGRLIETLTQFAPAVPITSLRQETQAHALRRARTCYDHLAGRLGVSIMRAMLDRGYLTGGDGTFDPVRAVRDRPTGYGHDVDYALSVDGLAFLEDLGATMPSGRRPVRYCIDWSEQHHHLAGGAGRAIHDRLTDLAWIRRAPSNRAVRITDAGHAGLRERLGIDLDADVPAGGHG